jgi:hypothetical protein
MIMPTRIKSGMTLRRKVVPLPDHILRAVALTRANSSGAGSPDMEAHHFRAKLLDQGALPVTEGAARQLDARDVGTGPRTRGDDGGRGLHGCDGPFSPLKRDKRKRARS